ncbi:hypothetical protein CFP56_001246 [Quercus suber]|uniref:Uncharacterized protein n=1 Tax=Quercus suber TaxID=58331 RepID=A0AAW0INE0_QUESU
MYLETSKVKKQSHDRRKQSTRRSEDDHLKQPDIVKCELALEGVISREYLNHVFMLLNDEELELQELEGGPNPLRCSDRFAANGVHGWSLYKVFGRDLMFDFLFLNVVYLEELMGSILFCRVACGINLASLAEPIDDVNGDNGGELVLSVFHASEGSTEYIYSTIINPGIYVGHIFMLENKILSREAETISEPGSRFSHATVAWHEFKFLCLEATEQYSTLYWLGSARTILEKYLKPAVSLAEDQT